MALLDYVKIPCHQASRPSESQHMAPREGGCIFTAFASEDLKLPGCAPATSLSTACHCTLSRPSLLLLPPQFGYISLFPLLMRLIPPDSPVLGRQLELLRDPQRLWTNFGLRSLRLVWWGMGDLRLHLRLRQDQLLGRGLGPVCNCSEVSKGGTHLVHRKAKLGVLGCSRGGGHKHASHGSIG